MADKRKLQGKHGGNVYSSSILVRGNCRGEWRDVYTSPFSLAAEIDRCLKKITEGVETFEDIWQKVVIFEHEIWVHLYTCHNYIQQFDCSYCRYISLHATRGKPVVICFSFLRYTMQRMRTKRKSTKRILKRKSRNYRWLSTLFSLSHRVIKLLLSNFVDACSDFVTRLKRG